MRLIGKAHILPIYIAILYPATKNLPRRFMQPIYPWRLSLLGLFLFTALYLICWQWFDLPLAIWAHHSFLPNTVTYDYSQAISHVFASAHWTYLALLCLIFMVIAYVIDDRSIARNWLFVATCILLTQLIGFSFKFLLARYRPIEWFNHGLYGLHFFSRQHDWNSTPSGHTLSTVAGCLALSKLFKQCVLTWLLIVLAIVVGLTRIIVTAHYLSDVLFGAYLALLVVVWLNAVFFNRDTQRS